LNATGIQSNSTSRDALPRLRVLSLGWGVQSWTLAAMMALDAIPRADYLIHADTTWEREATYDFARKWTPWLGEHGLEVVTVQSDRTKVLETWTSTGVMIPAFTLSRDDAKNGQPRHPLYVPAATELIRMDLAPESLDTR
jgi:3'-phosphoadenosine 5'-phosphosulfate sulfotransferase (PAPS reductase)/FAD synthetase